MKKRPIFYPISRPIFGLAAISSLTALLITACVAGVGSTNVNVDRLTEVTVAFEGATDRTVQEDGAVELMVRLSETPDRQVPIPITIMPQGEATAGDYSSSATTVTFEADDSGDGLTKILAITAAKDGILIELDESLEIGFGDLPEGVEFGDPNKVTIHIEDTDNLEVNLREREDGSNPLTIYTLATTEGVSYSIIDAREIRRDGAAARDKSTLENLFMIDSDSGVFSYIGGGESYAETENIVLTIEASGNGQSDTATVTITITDEDAPPAFTQSNYVVELVENQNGSSSPIPLNTTDPTRPIKATDPDAGDSVTYAISSTDNARETERRGTARNSADLKALFAIDTNSGVVSYVEAGEDFEKTASIILPVTANSGGQSDTATVTITITNEDEAPAFTEDNYTVNLAEDRAGTIPLDTTPPIEAIDPDVGNVVTYAISTVAAATETTRGGAMARSSEILKALFMIGSSGGVSYRGGGEDFERTASIILPVTANSGGQSDTATVTITITNIEGNALVAISGTLAQRGELTASIVGNPDGLDPDDSTYSYQWLRAGAVIASATTATYSLTADDVGKLIEVKVSYRDRSGNFKTVTAGTSTLLPAILEDSASSGGRRNDDGKAVTAAQLAMVFDHVNTYIETRYQAAILAEADFSDPPTLAQVQELIDEESANLSTLYLGQLSFNDNISDMDTSGATNMSEMFSSALSFNRDIGAWDVSNVTNMQEMFSSTSAFNQLIGRWDVGNVTNMQEMFNSAVVFNQDIGAWNVSNVTNMQEMFHNALVFDQDIGAWNVSNVTNMQEMFDGAELSTGNYDSLLAGWARRVGVVSSRSFHGGESKYSHASAREYWISKGWTIEDGGPADNVTQGTANADTGSAPGNSLDKSTETGAQILHGLAGADAITGGSANDIIHGGADNDTINGGGGADEIHGAAGDDTLSGGADADTFVFSYPNAGNDTISDFTTGASGDVIDISLLLEGYVTGSSTLSNFVTAATSGGTTTLTIDPNGDGTTTDQVTIILTNVSTTVEALVNGGNLKLE